MSISCRVPDGFQAYPSRLAFDRQGNLYCCGRLGVPAAEQKSSGDGDGRDVSPLWSFSPQGELRWHCQERLPNVDAPHIAVGRDKDLYLWFEREHPLWRLSAETGELRGELGGREPEGVKAPQLDLADCRQLQVDRDGTLLTEIHGRLLRWAPDGAHQRTWPPPDILTRALSFGLVGWERRRPLYRGPDREPVTGFYGRLARMQVAPLGVTGEWCLGWDGHIYVCEESYNSATKGVWLAKIARSGDLIYKVRFPEYKTGSRPPQADASGRAYLDVQTKQSDSALLRIAPDGSEARRFTGVYKDHERFAVASDGTLAIGRDEIELLPPGRQASRPERAPESEAEAGAWAGAETGVEAGGRRAWTADSQSMLPPTASREAQILLGVFVLLGAVRILFQLFWFQPLVEHHARTNTKYESRSKHGVTRISAASCRKASTLVRGDVIKEGVIIAFFLALLLVARKHPMQALFASIIAFVAAHGIQWAAQPAVLGTMPEFWMTSWNFVLSLTTGLTAPILGIFAAHMRFA